jgi:hypothetical protein
MSKRIIIKCLQMWQKYPFVKAIFVMKNTNEEIFSGKDNYEEVFTCSIL